MFLLRDKYSTRRTLKPLQVDQQQTVCFEDISRFFKDSSPDGIRSVSCFTIKRSLIVSQVATQFIKPNDEGRTFQGLVCTFDIII